MARDGRDLFDFTGADNQVGKWLSTTGRAVVPIVLAVIVIFGVALGFV